MSKSEYRGIFGRKASASAPTGPAGAVTDERFTELGNMTKRLAEMLSAHEVEQKTFVHSVEDAFGRAEKVLDDHEKRLSDLEKHCLNEAVKKAADPAPAATAAKKAAADPAPAASAKKAADPVSAPAAPAAKKTASAPAATAAKKAAADPAPAASAVKKVEEDVKYLNEAGVNKCFNGPGLAYKYWIPKLKMWGIKVDLWAAKRAGNGVYEPVWVWFVDGAIDHILDAEEVRQYAP